MVDLGRPARTLRGPALTLLVAWSAAGCAVVPGSRLDESQRLVQSLRAENARLKDRVLGLETQNRDFADRAIDDLRRVTARDQAIERLKRSVQAYQDDRDRLEAAYRRLAVGLGRTTEDLSTPAEDQPRRSAAANRSVVRADLAGGGGSEGLSAQGDGDGDDSRTRVPGGGSGP